MSNKKKNRCFGVRYNAAGHYYVDTVVTARSSSLEYLRVLKLNQSSFLKLKSQLLLVMEAYNKSKT